MFKKQFIISLVIATVICTSAYGQGEFLKPGQSGFGMFVSHVASDEISDATAQVGYSFYGWIDLGFVAAGMTDPRWPDLNIYMPYLSFYPLKQGWKRLPFSLALTPGIQWLDGRRNYRVFYFDESLLTNLDLSERLLLQPSLSASLAAPMGTYGDTEYGFSAGFTAGFLASRRIRVLAHYGLSRIGGSGYEVEESVGLGVMIQTGGVL